MNTIKIQLEEMMNQAPCGVGIFQLPGNGELSGAYLNDTYFKLVGYSREEYKAKQNDPVNSLVYEEDIPEVTRVQKQFLKTYQDVTCEYRIKNKKNQIVWIKLNMSVMSIEGKKYAFTSFVDVSKEKELEDQLQMISNGVSSSVSIIRVENNKANLVFANQAFSTITGFSREQYMQDTLKYAKEEVASQYMHRVGILVEKALKTGETQTVEYPLKRQDNTTVWLRRKFTAVPQESKGTYLLLSVTDDITDLHQAEETMLTERNMYESILDESKAMITIIDVQSHKIVYANRQAKMVTKSFDREYVGSTCYENIAHRTTPCEHCLIEHDAVMGEFKKTEIPYGNRVYAMLHKVIEWNGKKALMEYSEDITEQKSNEIYEKERKETLTRILANVPTGIVLYQWKDDVLTIVDVNPVMEKMIEAGENSVTGLRIEQTMDRIVPEDKGKLLDFINKLKQPDAKAHTEFRHMLKNNDIVWLSVRGRSLSTPDGAVQIYASYIDVTEEKKLQKVQMELETAKRASKAKSDFLSNMSHEIRTPMNAIIGLTNLALDEVNNVETITEYLKEISSSSEYLLGVINDILDMSRIESGKSELHPEWTTPGNIVMECIHMVEPMMHQKKIHFEYPERLKTGIPYEAYMDVQKNRQMIMNLLNNAYKFTPEGGHVRMSMKNISIDKEKQIATDETIIEDDGCGMTKEFLKKIFLPFEQERNEYTGAIQGTGLGLALARNIARQMGGDISVRSELGKGSAFTICYTYQYRTLKDKSPGCVDAETRSLPTESLKGKHILLVEDHPLNAKISSKLLEKQSIEVTIAQNGLEGVDKFCASQENYFDAILMDMRMPKMGGIEATKCIRQLDRKDASTIPIIAMTANAFEEDRQQTKAAGMNAHLSKPIEPDKLYSTLVKLL